MDALLQYLLKLLISNTAELLGFGVVMLILQWLLPAHKEQKVFNKSSAIDLSYSYILTLCFPFFVLVPIAATKIMMDWGIGLEKIYELIAVNLSLPLQVIAAIVLIDFISYWRHRIMHMQPLWPMHAIHHCSTRLDWLSTERFHVFNYFIIVFINTVVVTLCFGPAAALYSAMARRFYNFLIHANIKLDYGPLNYVFVCPRFHHWHHSSDRRAINCNYTTFFSFFDLIFGTYYLPKDKSYPAEMGEPDRIPDNLISQFIYPLRCWGRLLIGKPPVLRGAIKQERSLETN